MNESQYGSPIILGRDGSTASRTCRSFVSGSGNVIPSPTLDNRARQVLGLTLFLKATHQQVGHAAYHEWHRNKVFIST